MKVYLLEVDKSTVTDVIDVENNANAVKVFDGDYTFDDNVSEIEFTEPYVYNGGDLIISIQNSISGDDVNNYFYSEEQDNRSVYLCYGSESGGSNYLAKCTFDYVADQNTYTVTWA